MCLLGAVISALPADKPSPFKTDMFEDSDDINDPRLHTVYGRQYQTNINGTRYSVEGYCEVRTRKYKGNWRNQCNEFGESFLPHQIQVDDYDLRYSVQLEAHIHGQQQPERFEYQIITNSTEGKIATEPTWQDIVQKLKQVADIWKPVIMESNVAEGELCFLSFLCPLLARSVYFLAYSMADTPARNHLENLN